MAKFKYIGPPERTRFKGGSYSVGDVADVSDATSESFKNHPGFEALDTPKPPAKPQVKKSKKPAESPKAEKETSKE
tara:strand:+ start:122 stop:349 length:228 start_codon:yes stop_codon:yes gene_type:complete